MEFSWILQNIWLTILVFSVCIEEIGCKGGFGRGGGFGRAGGRSRGGGGLFGSRTAGRTNMGAAPPPYSRTSGGRSSHDAPPAYSGRNNGAHGFNQNANYRGQGGYYGGSGGGARYTKGSGVGSFVRSNQFKNAIVGAAAGYLTYQAGRAIIRSAMAPMMWNNRPYYWGSNYYRGGPGQTMCRMPMDANDSTLGNVYFSDNSRPKEIVWGCGYNEYCCGYECCHSNNAGGYGGYGNYGYGIGSFIVVALLMCCCFFLIKKSCDRNGYQPGRGF